MTSFRIALAGLLALGAGRVAGPAQVIHLNAGDVRTAATVRQASARTLAADFQGNRLHLVQFDGPIQPEWVARLEQAGWRIVDYVPDNAYLVYGGAAALKAVRATAKHLQWEGAYLPSDKIQPRARTAHGLFAVQLVLDEQANAETMALLAALAQAPLQRNDVFRHYRNVVVRLASAEVDAIAARPDVISIAPHGLPQKMDERQAMILAGQLSGNALAGPGYLAWLVSKGFTQKQFTDSGLVVDLVDAGLDNGTTSPNHFGFYTGGNTGLASRIAYIRLEGMPNPGSTLEGCDGHGTLNGHIIGGYNDRINGFPHQDSAGFRYGLGLAPFVKLGSSVVFDSEKWTSPDYSNMLSRAYAGGARISAETWGRPNNSVYDIDAQVYDTLVRDAQPAGSVMAANGNQEITIVFPAGNDGPVAGTIASPGSAKNVITVGAAENVHSHAATNGGADAAGTDGWGYKDVLADNANEMLSFSSRGPCADGRQKPDLVAPGTHVTGGTPEAVKTMAGLGTGLACFSAQWICAMPGGGTMGNTNNYFPLGQQWYSTSSGTSHSTAAAAGGAALVWQYFVNRGWGQPSPAMVKAYLMNATRYLTGTNANDTLWSPAQGMGEMNLGFAFDGTARLLRDQLTNDTFTASGQSRTFRGMVVRTNKPVRITLTWTDAPGSTTGNAYKNDLDLRVAAGGKTYLGNVFSGAFSTTGGVADAKDNVESVFLPAGTTGWVEVVVAAANINSDGVPNVAPTLDQDFALVSCNLAAAKISAFGKTNGASYAARLQTTTNAQYRLDYTRSLATNPVLWTPVATNVGTGGEISLTDTNIGADLKRYYRIAVP